LLFFTLTLAPAASGEIHDAASSGDIGKIKELLKKNPSLVNARDSDIRNRTPLSFAKNKETAEFLISKGADVNARDYLGRTPLF